MKILIIDDEQIILNVVERVLKSQGHNTYCLLDGTNALEVVKEFSPEAIFLDMKMPLCSGLDILENIKNYNSYIKVIMMSGYVAQEDMDRASKLGATSFLRKPFDDIFSISEALSIV